MKRETTKPWYEERGGYFNPDYLKEYEWILTPDKTSQEVDFLEKNVGLNRNDLVFDLACGHGRHVIELARRGYAVIGQDINGFFLQEARRKAKEDEVVISWVKADMRMIPFRRTLNVVINMFTSFGYFDQDEEDLAVLSEVFQALRPAGKFVIDIINREWLIRNFCPRNWIRYPDGSITLFEREFDVVAGRNLERRTRIKPNGQTSHLYLPHRVYTLAELASMCRNVGLQPIKTFGDYDGSNLTADTRRCILVAQKV